MIRSPGQGATNGGTGARGPGASLVNPHSLGTYLPALYQEDDFAQRFTAGLDEVLAPIFSSIDNLEAYLDPSLAPEDFVDWLGTWMGLVLDETWPLERRRAFVSRASDLYRVRGTPVGLAAHVEIFTGGEVEIVEGGGAGWSSKTGGELPGSRSPELLVRVTVSDPSTVDVARLNALVAEAKPAHLTHRVEVVSVSAPKPSAQRRASPRAAAPTQPASASPPDSPESAPPNEALPDAPPEPDPPNPG